MLDLYKSLLIFQIYNFAVNIDLQNLFLRKLNSKLTKYGNAENQENITVQIMFLNHRKKKRLTSL